MLSRRNLISDSTLVQETADLLQACGGFASAVEVVDAVFKLANIDSALAGKLIGDLLGADPRFELGEDFQVNLVERDHDARTLADTDFIVVDVEAAGTKLLPSRIIEIGAYHVTGGTIVARFEKLLNPGTPIPPFISSLTGISDGLVQHSPTFAEIANEWLDFVGDGVLVAHNAPFDLRVLNHEVGRAFPGLRMGNVSLCTIALSRHLIPELRRYRLDAVAEHFGIEIAARHRAGSDALATAHILLRLLQQMDELGIKDIGAARSFRLNPEARRARRDEAQLALDL
jgi:DNA polymerase III subunit epsilon